MVLKLSTPSSSLDPALMLSETVSELVGFNTHLHESIQPQRLVISDSFVVRLYNMIVLFFLPCDAMHSAAIAGMRCPSVCHVRELRQNE